MLTPTEQQLADATGVGAEVCLALKQLVPAKSLRRAHALDEMINIKPADAVALDVASGDEAERVMNGLEPIVAAHGCRAFWSKRHESNGLEISDEVVVMKTADPYAIVRLRKSNGAEYNVSTDDILDRLRAWESICTFDCVGASHDWVAVKFWKLPENLCTFAAEVCTFCPDTVEQGVGLADESDDPEFFEAARELCPDVPPVASERMNRQLEQIEELGDDVPEALRELLANMKESPRFAPGFASPDMGIRLLAEEIRRKRFLFLWWD